MQRKWVSCGGTECDPMDRGKSWGRRHHEDVCIVRQPLGLPHGGGLMLRRTREDVGAVRPDSIRTGARGGNGTKGKAQQLMKKDLRGSVTDKI